MLQAELAGVQSGNGPTKGLQRLKNEGGIEDSTMIQSLLKSKVCLLYHIESRTVYHASITNIECL